MTSLPPVATPLQEDEAEAAFGAMLDGGLADEDIASFLVELSDRGEAAAEIVGAAKAMRARMRRVSAPVNAIDVCGTGGDGSHSLNVSTAVALVVAASGVPVAKHGNRAASSKAGGADTLEALGLDLDRASDTAESTLADLGIAFLFAQKHHPALARLAPIRRALGRRTIFNLLGPLCNPAGVSRQLVGVASQELLFPYSEALQDLGADRFIVACGFVYRSRNARMDALDELSVSARSMLAQFPSPDDQSHRPMGWERGISYGNLEPANAGLPYHSATALRGGDPAYNADALRRLLLGEPGAYRDAVLLNAAAALIVAGEVDSWTVGVEEAAETIDKGLAKALLDCWIASTK